MRTCDKGACRLRAVMVGTYTSDTGERRTAAACGEDHSNELDCDLKARQLSPVWATLVKAGPHPNQTGGPAM